jgi:hypothetical protein
VTVTDDVGEVTHRDASIVTRPPPAAIRDPEPFVDAGGRSTAA